MFLNCFTKVLRPRPIASNSRGFTCWSPSLADQSPPVETPPHSAPQPMGEASVVMVTLGLLGDTGLNAVSILSTHHCSSFLAAEAAAVDSFIQTSKLPLLNFRAKIFSFSNCR